MLFIPLHRHQVSWGWGTIIAMSMDLLRGDGGLEGESEVETCCYKMKKAHTL